jgi:hypothetical protein
MEPAGLQVANEFDDDRRLAGAAGDHVADDDHRHGHGFAAQQTHAERRSMQRRQRAEERRQRQQRPRERTAPQPRALQRGRQAHVSGGRRRAPTTGWRT